MALNYIWVSFFIIAFVVGICRLIFLGDTEVFTSMVNSSFVNAKLGFEISLGLTGVLAFWMGIMKIGENSGMVNSLSRISQPLFSKLFPDIPKNNPATASILMNISANILGLDNAATPFGLKAMSQLQDLNDKKDTASNPMIMFIILNASGLTLIPITVMMYRAQLGASNPSDVFIPIMIATFMSTLVGVTAVCIRQKINIFNKSILLFFGILSLLILSTIIAFRSMSQENISMYSSLVANILLFGIIVFFIFRGVCKKINVFDSFIEGAKDGFYTAVKIIPFLVAILVAIGIFRASGAMDIIIDAIKWSVTSLGFDNRWVDGLPTALMKPLSGSGARGMMIDSINSFGADSFAGRLSSVLQGSTDTTFYVVAVYYGAVNIKNSRYTINYALLSDLVGITVAIFVSYLFFG